VEEDLDRVIPEAFGLHAHHWLILHGRYLCKARTPECWRCPVSEHCLFKDKTPAPDSPEAKAAKATKSSKAAKAAKSSKAAKAAKSSKVAKAKTSTKAKTAASPKSKPAAKRAIGKTAKS
ncbi:MAG: hypothetical protein AAFO75_07700, partial [Pseudomonadota bacterium]